MTLEELIKKQEAFEPYLKQGDYTFIGPVDQSLFEPFMKAANHYAPVVAFNRSIHHVLANKQAVQDAIRHFQANTPLRIFVVDGKRDPYIIHDTINGYIQKNQIDFK